MCQNFNLHRKRIRFLETQNFKANEYDIAGGVQKLHSCTLRNITRFRIDAGQSALERNLGTANFLLPLSNTHIHVRIAT